jgi:hypothetical protein
MAHLRGMRPARLKNVSSGGNSLEIFVWLRGVLLSDLLTCWICPFPAAAGSVTYWICPFPAVNPRALFRINIMVAGNNRYYKEYNGFTV